VRIDTGVGAGDRISPYYDSMIAKLIVWGADRDQALQRMGAALDQYRIVGVANNVNFLQRLVSAPAFARAELDTALIERESARLFPARQPPPRDIWLAAAVATLRRARAEADHSPWGTHDGWRLGARAQRELVFRAGDVQQVIGVHYLAAGWALHIDDRVIAASCNPEASSDTDFQLTLDGCRAPVTVVIAGGRLHVFAVGRRDVLEHIDPLTVSAATTAGPAGLRAPMPGRVIELIATAGAEVPRGAALLVMEAMKIEHTIVAPSAGTLRSYRVAVGEQVGEGTELVDFVPAQSK
jgi:3-methylcrotonyl-CoA carboxylase alpha subunit